jgi:hypothetical protein
MWNDTVQGLNKQLYSNTTNAQYTNTDQITAFNSNGFTTGASGTTNGNGASLVAWQWKAGGAAVSNTNGTITSQVSANTTSGFSVVTYTGTGSVATVGHGLGVTPSMFIVKRRDTAGYSWNVYHISTGNTGAMFLDTTNAFAADSTRFNNTSPTSSVFTIGTGAALNGSGGTFVAYCWAPIAGYSAFGSYTGNGSADGPFVYTGFRPRFVMIKRTDDAGAWWMYDTSRSNYNAAILYLFANTSAAEVSDTAEAIDFLSNGFKLRMPTYQPNNSGGTYIYMAFAENPLKFANAR